MFFHVCRGKQKKLEISGAEHKPRTIGNVNPAIKQHVETGHDIHPSYANILETGVSGRSKRLFLESLHSFLDKKLRKWKSTLPKGLRLTGRFPRGQRTITSQLIRILWIAWNHHCLKKTAEGGRKFSDNFTFLDLFWKFLNSNYEHRSLQQF